MLKNLKIHRLFLLLLAFQMQPWSTASEHLVEFSASASLIPAGVVAQAPRHSSAKKYRSMEELFEKAPIGPVLKSASVPTRCAFKFVAGYETIYQVIEDLPQFGMSVGDLFYLDKFHRDHIEVFNKTGTKPKTVLNCDGTKNEYKLQQAIDQNRQILTQARPQTRKQGM